MQKLKKKLQEKVNSPMSIQIECDIFQRVVNIIDDVYFEKEKEQISDAWLDGYCANDSDAVDSSNYYDSKFNRTKNGNTKQTE